MSKQNDGVCFDPRKGKWRFELDGKFGKHYESKELAAKAYVEMIVIRKPKYKDLLTGKKWPEIFKIIGVTI